MTPTDIETVYDALAAQIDSVGPEKSELFLIKLALLISHELSDANSVIQLIDYAKRNLDAAIYP